jgi:hypothetical protein
VIAITKRWNTINLSPGIVTFNPTGGNIRSTAPSHSFSAGSFSPARRSVASGVEIFQDWLLHSPADRNAELPVYGSDPFLALRHFIEPPSFTTLLAAP